MHRTARAVVFGSSTIPAAATVERLDAPMAPHGHDFLELAVVWSGTGRHDSAAGSVPLDRGSLVMLRPGDWHGFSGCRDLELMLVFVGTEVLAHELVWLRADPVLGRITWPVGRTRWSVAERERRVDDAALAALADPVEALARPVTGGPGERARRLGELLRVLGTVAPFAERSAPLPDEVLVALDVLERDPGLPWTLAALADVARCSPAHLVRLFGRHVGAPPMQCLARLRAERAAAALIETDEPVAAVGRRVGWADPAYASKRFRAFFGMSPSEYRTRMRD